jgi:hypothetical protein
LVGFGGGRDGRAPKMYDCSEPFGMPLTNHEVAVIVANELNQHERGMWSYKVERHIDGKRWIIVRDNPGDVFLRAADAKLVCDR